jgi:cell division protein FtsX
MHVLALRLALNHLKEKPFSRLVVVVSVACVLLMNAVVFLLFQSFSRSIAEVRASRFMTAYLESSVAPERETEVLSAIRKIPGVASAQLVSKDAFIENFAHYFPQMAGDLATLDADTIPRYVKVKADGGTEAQVQTKIEKLKGVEGVETNKNRYAGLLGALLTLRKLALGLMAGMSIALLCILLNHFKLRSSFQNQVRHTLQLLGARGGQVLLPFAIEGLIEGAAGGGLAAVALLMYGHLLESQLNGLFTGIGYHPYFFEVKGLAALLVAAGTISGMIGSLWATVRAKR